MEFGCEIPFKDKWSTFFFLLRRFPIDGVLPVVLSNCRCHKKDKKSRGIFQFLTYKLDKHYKRKERFFHLRFLRFWNLFLTSSILLMAAQMTYLILEECYLKLKLKSMAISNS